MRLVPPGGFAGFAQMTPASQDALTKRTGSNTGKRKAKTARSLTGVKPRGKLYKTSKKTGKRYKTRDPNKRRKRRGAKLKKGSPEAKARMAKLRKMRGKG